MQLFDQTTMPVDQAVRWDPNSMLGRAIIQQPWMGVSDPEKQIWLAHLNNPVNDNTFVSKLLDFEAFLTVVIRGTEVMAKFVIIPDFSELTRGPVFEGPYNWPNRQN